ncbi:cell division FtsA domain-containing protein [Halanaerocella petrolearia]
MNLVMQDREDLIFALDIGTRTIVGLILEPRGEDFIIKGSEVIEHNKRSMLDGQIHNVMEVANQVKKIKETLEDRYQVELRKVGVAAAGRALKTIQAHYGTEFKSKKEVTAEDMRVLEFGAVQQAQNKLQSQEEEKANSYHFVGYTVLQNKLDEIKVSNLIGQRGKEITVDVVATFLPRIVVDSLLTVIREADLEVEHLTLEPIAASNLIIPRQMHGFNLALVDIGAGTSDIAVTKEGAIIGYEMVPVAGDEITEAICEEYMVDYHTAERIKRGLWNEEEIEAKNILDQTITLRASDVVKEIKDKIGKLARLISQAILQLNGSQPQAVMCIGGGSLTPLLKQKLSAELDLPEARIGVKDIDNVDEVKGQIEDLSGSQAITPLGIAVSCYRNLNRANFLDVELNGDLIHLFTLTEPKVSDALLAAEIDVSNLKASPGMALTVEVAGELKVIKGTMGTKGELKVNGEEAEIDTQIENRDQIRVTLGQSGESGQGVVADVVPDFPIRKIEVNGEEVSVEPQYHMNGEEVSLDTELKDRAEIEYKVPQTIKEIVTEVLELDISDLSKNKITYTLNGTEESYSWQNYNLLLNDQPVTWEVEVNDGDKIEFNTGIGEELQIRDILEDDLEENLLITFNNRQIEVPVKNYQLLKNDQQANKEDYIQQGDKIEYQPEGIRLNQLLEYINYQVPKSLLEGNLVIEKNGQTAKLTEVLADGDEVKLYVSKEGKNKLI